MSIKLFDQHLNRLLLIELKIISVLNEWREFQYL